MMLGELGHLLPRRIRAHGGNSADESVEVAGGAVGERRFRCAEEDAEKWLHLADLP